MDSITNTALGLTAVKDVHTHTETVAAPTGTTMTTFKYSAPIEVDYVVEIPRVVTGYSEDNKYVKAIQDGSAFVDPAQYLVQPNLDTKTGNANPAIKQDQPTTKLVQPSYVADVQSILRTVAPEYVKQGTMNDRGVTLVYEKNSVAYNYADPIPTRNTVQLQRTAEPTYVRNVVHTKRTISYEPVKSAGYVLRPVTPGYVVTQQSKLVTIDGVSYTKLPVVRRTVEVQYERRGTRIANTIVPVPTVNGYTVRTASAAQPMKIAYVHNQRYDDTPEQQGTYATAVEAIAAGRAIGYDDVKANLLPNNTYMWSVVIPVPTTDCDGLPTGSEGLARPEKWYVHGG